MCSSTHPTPQTRFLANDEAVRRGIPLVHGAALGWAGLLLTVVPGRALACRCLFEAPPRNARPALWRRAGAALRPVGAAMHDSRLGPARRADAGMLHRWARSNAAALRLKRDPACGRGGIAASYERRS